MATPIIGTSGNKVFAPSILFIAWREAMEARLAIGILLASVETLVKDDLPVPSSSHNDGGWEPSFNEKDGVRGVEGKTESTEHFELVRKVLIRHLRKAIFPGAFIGLMIAVAIGAV